MLGGLAEALVMAIEASPRDMSAIVGVRSDLAIGLGEHLAKEDGFLYEKSIRATEANFTEALDRFESDFANLGEDWKAYLEEWPADAIAHDFDRFAEATVSLMGRLGARIAHENSLLYPLALQGGRIRLRAA
jgi:hypothetical protein